MKKTSSKLLALLLALLMLPFAPAMAAEEADVVNVRAIDLFGGEESTVVLLQSGGRYYISLVEAGDLAGLPITVGASGFSSGYLTVTPDMSALEQTRVGGTSYYALEQLMGEFQVQVFENGDGNLYYNSVPKNIEKLLAETDRVMSTDFYSADLLEDMGFEADFISAFSFIYDAVIHLRFNAIWGEAYRDDIKSLMLTLISPIEDEANLFETASKLNKTMNKAADIILKGQNYFEDFRSAVLLRPESYDYLLFGVEGTASLREFLETAQEVNGVEFFDAYLRSRLGYSGMKEYKAAAGEMDAGALSGVSALGIGDLLDAGEYIVSITQVTQAYAAALGQVLSAGNLSSGVKGLDKLARSVVHDQGLAVFGDYRRYMEQNLPGTIARGGAALLETVAENMTESVLETALLGKAKWLSGFLTFVSRHFSATVVKNDAVRNMTMYAQIQSLFKDCYGAAAAGEIGADSALLMKSAALLYLKSTWHSVGAFSFDTGSESLVDILRDSPGTPTGRLLGLIRDEMLALTEFPDEMFTFIENKTVFPAGTFRHTYSADMLDITIDDGSSAQADINFDGLDDTVEFVFGDRITIAFGGAGERWSVDLGGVSAWASQPKLRVIAYPGTLLFVEESYYSGRAEYAVGFQFYKSYDGLYARQRVNVFPNMDGAVSGDGRILSVSGEIGGYQESFAVLDSEALPQGCIIINDVYYTDYGLVSNQTGTDYDLFLGVPMFGSARANTAGIAYTRFTQGLGELTPVQQWFKPKPGVAEPLGANGVEEGDSEFPVDDTDE